MDSQKDNSNLYKKYSGSDKAKKSTGRKQSPIVEYRPISREGAEQGIGKPATPLKKKISTEQREEVPVKASLSSMEDIPIIEDISRSKPMMQDIITSEKNAFYSKPKRDSPLRITVHVGGMQYSLTVSGKAEETHLRNVARRADRILLQMQQKSPGSSMADLGILSLMNVVDDLMRKEEYLSELEDQFSSYVTNKETEKENSLALRSLNKDMTQEIKRLHTIIEKYAKIMPGDMTPDDFDDNLSQENMSGGWNLFDEDET